MWLYHGRDDPVIHPDIAKESYEVFNDRGFGFVFYVEPDLEHMTSHSEIRSLRNFLRDCMDTKFAPVDKITAKKNAEKMKRLIRGCTV